MEVNDNKPEQTVTNNEPFCGRINTSSYTAFDYEWNMNTEIEWFVSISKLQRLVKIWGHMKIGRDKMGYKIVQNVENWKSGFSVYHFSFQQSHYGFSYVKLQDICEKGKDFFHSALETDSNSFKLLSA